MPGVGRRANDLKRPDSTQLTAPWKLGDWCSCPRDHLITVHEKLGRFSVQKLMALVARLGFAVSIHVEGSGVAFDVPLRRAA